MKSRLSMMVAIATGALVVAGCATPRSARTTPEAGPALPERSIRAEIPITRTIARAYKAGTRDSTGRPTAKYWQVRTEYQINASLDPTTNTITGTETIVFYNESPDTLGSIGLRLDQNIWKTGNRRAGQAPDAGFNITKLSVAGVDIDLTPERNNGNRAPVVMGSLNTTNTAIRLQNPLPPNASVTISAEWNFVVPAQGMRMGRFGDSLYQLAQWYPRIAVYDDLRGWDTEQYFGSSEFYNNFGRFDVKLEVPAGWVVGATGVLQNPGEVLSSTVIDRLSRVLETDEVQTIVGPEDFGPGKATVEGDRLVWHFSADSVADFAWAASSQYVWKATRANIAGVGAIPVHIMYLPANEKAFEAGPRVVRHALEFYSDLWMPYAFPQLTMVDGPEGGMEYPMFIMSGVWAADHEVGHEWWPMMVGNNETWYGWMDEGFNMYMNILSDSHREGKAPRLDGQGQQYGMMAGNEMEPPAMWNANYAGPMYGFQTYFKTPLMLSSLGGIVGDSAVQRAMSDWAKAWRFKHPTPWDYIFFMNNALGQDLDWFWYGWLFANETTDGSIHAVDTDGSHTIVTVHQAGQLPSPVVLKVELDEGPGSIRLPDNAVITDNNVVVITYPVDVWFGGSRTFEAEFDFGRTVRKITLDPYGRFPDSKPNDNTWTASDKPVAEEEGEEEVEKVTESGRVYESTPESHDRD